MGRKRQYDLEHVSFIPFVPEIVPSGENKGLYPMPVSSTTNFMTEIFNAGDSLNELPDRKLKVSHDAQYRVLANGNVRRVEYEKGNQRIVAQMQDVTQLGTRTGNVTLSKLFHLFLQQTAIQALNNGKVIKDEISFPIQTLVDLGIYKHEKAAIRGFKQAFRAILAMTIEVEQKRGRKTEHYEAVGLLRKVTYRNGQCRILIESAAPWNVICQCYTLLPRYYYALPNRGAALLEYIFYLARQRDDSIRKHGYFTISFRAIQQRLMLPDVKDTKSPSDKIRRPIEQAIEQIEDAQQEYYKGRKNKREFLMTPIPAGIETAKVARFLDEGKLKIELAGDFAAPFIERSQIKTKKIAQRKKRVQKIKDDAAARSLAEKMKQKETEQR